MVLSPTNDQSNNNEEAVTVVTGEEVAIDSGNTAWMITATALVLFMTLPGLALFYGGLVQSKNVLSVLNALFCDCMHGINYLDRCRI